MNALRPAATGMRVIAILVLCGSGLLVADRCLATAIVAQEDWNDGTPAGWTAPGQAGWVAYQNPGSGGIDDSGYLHVQLAETDPLNELSGDEWWSLVQVDAATLYSGEWSTNYYIQFQFRSSNAVPDYVQVRWSGDTNRVWRDTVFTAGDSLNGTNWTQLRSDGFGNWASWNYGGGTEENFLLDLGSIDWIGVFIWRGDDSLQNYGLDDFNLMVPEPAEWILLAVVLVASGHSLRRRRGLSVTGH